MKAGRYCYVVALLLFVAGAINYMDRAALGVVARIINKELRLSPSELGHRVQQLLRRLFHLCVRRPPPGRLIRTAPRVQLGDGKLLTFVNSGELMNVISASVDTTRGISNLQQSFRPALSTNRTAPRLGVTTDSRAGSSSYRRAWATTRHWSPCQQARADPVGGAGQGGTVRSVLGGRPHW
jgi:hypothetical protein